MIYEICVRPYDRTPEGNLPKYYTKEFDNDKKALAAALAIDVYTGDIDPAEVREYITLPINELKTILFNYDPSDAFVFYVKNKTKDEIIFDSGEDPKEWEADYYRDDEDDWDDEDDENYEPAEYTDEDLHPRDYRYKVTFQRQDTGEYLETRKPTWTNNIENAAVVYLTDEGLKDPFWIESSEKYGLKPGTLKLVIIRRPLK